MTSDCNSNDNAEGEVDDTKGTALLLKQLKLKDAEHAQMQKERDASLAKATKLSLALATTRELNDTLQEKLEVQSSYSFFTKSPTAAVHHVVSPSTQKTLLKTTPTEIATPTLGTLHRHSSGEGVNNNTTADNASGGGRFDGRRIRNFFGRGKSNSMTPATTPPTAPASLTPNANDSNGNSNTPFQQQPSTQANLSKSRLFQRNTSANSQTSNGSSHGDSNHGGATKDTITEGGNPFDDDLNASFANPSVGMASSIDENVQGGGGDINLALTL